MQTLEEYNRERRKDYEPTEALRRPHLNDIACPNCGKELWDSNPMVILASNPPQKDVHCPTCGYKGYRLV